jgi:hypothetical protein
VQNNGVVDKDNLREIRSHVDPLGVSDTPTGGNARKLLLGHIIAVRFLPTMFTSAALFACDFDPSELDPTTGDSHLIRRI